MYISPDHFLGTPEGRIITPERNAVAWRQCFSSLEDALLAASGDAAVFVMVGCQGSGKSTWARAFSQRVPTAIIFDAILVKRSERAPILDAAARHQVPAIAVWLKTPLSTCISRNRSRPADEIADEQGLRNVFVALEPPSIEEGFSEVVVVEPS